MGRMKGGELIAEYLIKQKVPYLFGTCGHVDAEVRPPSTVTWQLPPTPFKEPTFGKPWLPS